MLIKSSRTIRFAVWSCLMFGVYSFSAMPCRAQNIVGNPTATQTLTQPPNMRSPANLNVNRFDNIRFAGQFPGTGTHDCGDKINQADQDLYTMPPGGGTVISGEIWVNNNCGSTISTPVFINQFHVLRFIDEPAGANCYQVSAKIQIGNGGGSGYGSGMISRSSGQLSVPGPVCLQMASGANLPVMVQMAGPQSFIRDLFLDGNKANNPAAGTLLQLQSTTTAASSAWFQEVDHVTIQNSRGLGARVISTGTHGETSAATFDRVQLWGNELGCLEIENTVNFIVRNGACENSGVGGGSLGAVFPVVDTNGTSVSWVSGPKWTTDSSIVGRTAVINGTRYTIAAAPSATSLTLSTSAGSQTNRKLKIGTGIEAFNSRGSGMYFNDVSGHNVDGVYIYGLNPGAPTNAVGAWGMIIFGNTFSGNIEHDVDIVGFDYTNGAFASYGNEIANNYFGGKITGSNSAIRAGLYIVDSHSNHISSNTFEAFNGNTHGFAMQETVANREGNFGNHDNRDLFALSNSCWVNSGSSFSGSCITQQVVTPPASAPLFGLTASIGGNALMAGSCTSGTVTIRGVVAGMPAIAVPSDGSDVGQGFFVKAYATALNVVTVSVCAVVNGTPRAKTYNVRMVP